MGADESTRTGSPVPTEVASPLGRRGPGLRAPGCRRSGAADDQVSGA